MSTASNREENAFQTLVDSLARVLGPSSGLDSADVDTASLMTLMRGYDSKPKEWRKYAMGDPSRGYTRNLVDKGNGKSNLLILVWTPGKGSPIHDHSNAHCIMKVLSGTLKETLYDWPDQNLVKNGNPSPPTVTKESLYHTNEVTYISDQLGVHRVMNPDAEEMAVSLHLYTPPHAAIQGCHMFDAKTGKPSHVQPVQYFSEFGEVSKSSM